MTDQQALRRIVSMTLLGLRLRPADMESLDGPTLIRLEAAGATLRPVGSGGA
jgi:hypothetical protein